MRVPKVFWTYTRSRVLTLEWLDGDPGRRPRSGAMVARGSPRPRVPDDGDLDDDDLPSRVLPRRPSSGQHPRPRAGRTDRTGRLRRRRQADRRRHVEADADVHRRGRGECRGVATQALRARRALPEGAGRGVPRRAARDVLPLLRRKPGGDRSDAGDPGGLPADLLDEPAAADPLPVAGQGNRDARLGRCRSLPGLQRLRGGAPVCALA